MSKTQQHSKGTVNNNIKNLHPIAFVRWRLNIVGPLPIVSQKIKYIFVMVDYFIKWAKAEPISTISNKITMDFVFNKIVCRYGMSVQIITNNGTQFANMEMKKLCSDIENKQSFVSVYHRKTNGQVEVANKTITKILKRKVGENPENWTDILLDVMWAYKTSGKQKLVGHTSFALAFGLEVVAPSKLVQPMIKILGYDECHNEEVMMKKTITNKFERRH